MIENINDTIVFSIIIGIPLLIFAYLFFSSELFKSRKSNFNKDYYDEDLDSLNDEIDY